MNVIEIQKVFRYLKFGVNHHLSVETAMVNC